MKLVAMSVVECLHLGIADVLGPNSVFELIAHELLDHDLFHRPDHVGVAVETAPEGLFGEDFELDETVEKLLFLLLRSVAGADVGRLAMDALLEVANRDDDVVDGCQRRVEVALLALRAPGLPGRFAGAQ